MPHGFFGTRASLLLDVVLTLNLIAPFWAYGAARLARKGEHQKHIRLQLVLIALLFACVFLLEGAIRLAGGSGSLVAASPYAGTPLLRWVFVAHIGPAVFTYLVWLGLVITSYRRRHSALPGNFSKRHKALGLAVIVGLVWVAASAIAVYWLGFVAT